MKLFRFLFRRRFPDWKMVQLKLYKETDWHCEQRDKAKASGNLTKASEHQISGNVLLGIASSLQYGLEAVKEDLS